MAADELTVSVRLVAGEIIAHQKAFYCIFERVRVQKLRRYYQYGQEGHQSWY